MLLGAARWVILWFLIVAGMCLAGALAGAILFPIAGRLLGMDLSITEMILNGVQDGGFLALIWAPGTAIVVCFMRAHALARKRQPDFPKALDRQN